MSLLYPPSLYSVGPFKGHPCTRCYAPSITGLSKSMENIFRWSHTAHPMLLLKKNKIKDVLTFLDDYFYYMYLNIVYIYRNT
jgi:hypothetical protein